MPIISAPKEGPPVLPDEDYGPKVKAHQRYYVNGRQVPGASTISKMLPVPELVHWANRLGLQGIDSDKYVDEAAVTGSLVHYLIQCELCHFEPELKDYTAEQRWRANISMGLFRDWRRAHVLKPMLVEEPLMSTLYAFGGTIDFYGEVNDRLELVDVKSSKLVYAQQVIQVAGYRELLIQNGYSIEGARILRINRLGGLEDRRLTDQELSIGWEMFWRLRDIYGLNKQLEAE